MTSRKIWGEISRHGMTYRTSETRVEKQYPSLELSNSLFKSLKHTDRQLSSRQEACNICHPWLWFFWRSRGGHKTKTNSRRNRWRLDRPHHPTSVETVYISPYPGRTGLQHTKTSCINENTEDETSSCETCNTNLAQSNSQVKWNDPRASVYTANLDGELKLIGIYVQSSLPAEENVSASEQEWYAIVWELKTFRP